MLNRFAHLIGNDVPGALNMWRVLSVTMFISIAVCAAEPLGNDEVTDAEIEKLVTCLISPNQAPQIPGIIAKYPANFDKAAQKIEVLEWVLAEEEKHPDKYTEKDRALVQKELDERKLFKVARKPSWPFSK